MKLLLLVMLVTVVWAVLASVLGRCGGRRVAGERGSAVREAWFWEALDRDARLAGVPALPSSHPLARFCSSSSQPTV
jgi:hypothetical protein